MRVIAYVAIALVCAAFAVPTLVPSQDPAVTWEYKVVTPSILAGVKADIRAAYASRENEKNDAWKALQVRVRGEEDLKIAAAFNELGKEGWELVSNGFAFAEEKEARFIFKRRR